MAQSEKYGLLFGSTALALFAGALCVAGYEMFHWLKYGVRAGWTVYTLISNLSGDFLYPAYYSQDWIGFARIVQFVFNVDLWFALVMAGGLSTWGAITLNSK